MSTMPLSAQQVHIVNHYIACLNLFAAFMVFTCLQKPMWPFGISLNIWKLSKYEKQTNSWYNLSISPKITLAVHNTSYICYKKEI